MLNAALDLDLAQNRSLWRLMSSHSARTRSGSYYYWTGFVRKSALASSQRAYRPLSPYGTDIDNRRRNSGGPTPWHARSNLKLLK